MASINNNYFRARNKLNKAPFRVNLKPKKRRINKYYKIAFRNSRYHRRFFFYLSRWKNKYGFFHHWDYAHKFTSSAAAEGVIMGLEALFSTVRISDYPKLMRDLVRELKRAHFKIMDA
jgi:hypothetical protein